MNELGLEQVYRMTYPTVQRRVSRFLPTCDVEEAVQDVFLKVAQALGKFDGRSSITTWTYKIATNHCLNKIRDEKRHRELLEQWASDLIPVDIGASPDDRILLSQIWDDLDPELIETAFYYYVDGMTQSEIGDVLSVSERTVRNRLQRLVEHGKTIQESV